LASAGRAFSAGAMHRGAGASELTVGRVDFRTIDPSHRRIFPGSLGSASLGLSYCGIHSSTSDESSSMEPALQLDLESVLPSLEMERTLLEASCSESAIHIAKMQECLFSMHSGLDLSWAATIILASCAMRLATFPFTIMQMKHTARLTKAKPEIEKLVGKVKDAQAQGADQATMTGYTDQLNAIWKKHDCHPVRGLLNVVVQAPLFISFFLSVQRLARADLPSMKTGGMLWFPDLSAADPMYALPIVSAAFFLATVELGAMDGAPNQQTNQMKNVMRILSVVIVPLTMKMPAAVILYFMSSSIFSLVQVNLLKIPALRSLFGVPAVAPAAASSSVQPLPPKSTKLYKSKPKSK